MDKSNLTFNPTKEQNMLDYIKTILDKVSFDKFLFEKELRKALKSLMPNEIKVLKDWCHQRFDKEYAPIINQCFVGHN